MPKRKSRRGFHLKILNDLRRAAKQNVDTIPGSSGQGGDGAVLANSTFDHQGEDDATLDISSVAQVGQNEGSKEVSKDQPEARKLRRRLETYHTKINLTEMQKLRYIEQRRERRECELPRERRQRLMAENFRKALARMTETSEQRKKRLQRNCEASARARATETKEKREERLRRNAEYATARRKRLREQLLLQQQLPDWADTNKAEAEAESTGKMPLQYTSSEASLDCTDSLRREIHPREKLHKCPLCLASFSMIDDLRAHILTIDTGEKPHACPLCLASFSASGSLKAHILTTHTGETPHDSFQRNVKEEKLMGISMCTNGSSLELGSCQIKEEMDIEVVEHGLDQISY